jgi:RNA recognition motif-containing protein
MYTQRIIVTNLSWNTSEEDLYQLFEKAGDVTKVRLVTQSDSGESLGVAFVIMSAEKQNRKAVKLLDGNMFEGKKISVRIEDPELLNINQLILASA